MVDINPPNMKFLFTMLLLFWSSSQFTVSEAASCTNYTSEDIPEPKCTTYVVVERTKIEKNFFNVRIPLAEGQKKVRIFCGKHNETFNLSSFGKTANELRVSFPGKLKLKTFSCDDLSGSTCVFNSYSAVCPGPTTSNHLCIYEVNKAKTSTTTTANTVKANAGIEAEVIEKVKDSFTIEQLRQRTELKEVTLSSGSYIVVPSGYYYCSYSEAKTVKDEWQCFLPKYSQREFTGTVQCSSLPLCKKGVCPQEEDDSGCAAMTSFNVLMLIVTSVVIVICLK